MSATAVTFHETLRATGAMRFRTSAFPLAWALPANHALFGSLQAAERCVACTSGDAMSATAVMPANAVVLHLRLLTITTAPSFHTAVLLLHTPSHGNQNQNPL